MSKIPSNDEVRHWYNETLKLPSFLDTLNNYQKGKLIEYCQNKISITFEFAIGVLNAKPDNEYPEEIPIEEHLNYILNTTFKNANSEPIYILNLLGYTWTPEESYKRINIEKTKEIDLNPSIIKTVFDQLKDYFNTEEHHNLNLILLGNSINQRLNFKSQQNKLADVFFQLHKQNLIFDSKEETANWLSKNFTYNNKGKQTNCSKSSCADCLNISKEESRPNKEDRILLNIKKN